MATIKIDIDPDAVVIEGQAVQRPPWVSRSDWDSFWHRVKRGAPISSWSPPPQVRAL